MFAKKPNPVQHICILPAVIVLVACGCAQLRDVRNKLKDVTNKLEDVSVQREERKQKVVEDFARRRDDTQYRASLACWERGDVRGCESQLIDLLQRNPDHLEARLALADLCLERGKSWAAEQQYRESIERHPQQAQSHYGYGLFLDVAGRTDEAAEHFRRAAKIEPDNPAYAALAASGGNPTEVATAAASASAASVTAVPDHPDLAVSTAADLLQAGKAESALQLAAAASERYPKDIRLKHAVASAQFESGDPKSAQVTLQQALSLDKGNALTYFLLGYTLKAQGDEEVAQRHFAKARQLDPRLASQR
jgi:Flp pilus assembly protein TadD